MKQQTAVEWLEEIYLTIGIDRNVHFIQAKQMEKQQIIEAFWSGDNSDCTSEQNSKEFAEKYYNTTYTNETT